jgi:hypothetical protein
MLSQLRVVCTPGSDAGGFARRTDGWRAHWTAPDGSVVKLGRAFGDEASARKQWGLLGGDGSVIARCDKSGARLLLRRADRLAVGLLADVCKAMNEPLNASELASLGGVAESPSAPYLVDWAEALVGPSAPMADSFAVLRPGYEGRFTCWEQYTNGRYSNAGSRIDYIWVDRQLFDARALAGAEMADGRGPAASGEPHRFAVQSEEAAAAAATAGGLWVQAPFDGSGLQEAPLAAYATQFEAPGTGIRYMPPKYSDHTAVSLLLAEKTEARAPLKLSLDAATLKASPHRSNRSITSFFSKAVPGAAAGDAGGGGSGGAGGGADGGGDSSGKKRKEPPLPPGQKGLVGFWDKTAG